MEKYLYDSTYRLLGVVSTKPETFSYDAVGNRLTGPGVKDVGYLYNAGNQMLQGRKLRYGYDNSGNQATRAIPGATDKNWSLTWDYENRLIKVEKVSGPENRTVKFSYDPLGRRIGKQVTTVFDGVTKTEVHAYVYDNDNIIFEAVTDATGISRTFFTHGPGADEHLAMERNGQFSYYHADGLGCVVAITDQNKRVVQSYEYGSFGMLKPSLKSANNYTYTGREWDKETGLYYYRARYYDPMEGRFISKDPIEFGGGINQYAYVENNPMNWTDPSGLLMSSNPSSLDHIFHPNHIHGNWCGPNWTGGQEEEYSKTKDVGGHYRPPVDSLDAACEIHDKCYATCRKQNKCAKFFRAQCFLSCDQVLSTSAQSDGAMAGLAVGCYGSPRPSE